VRWGVELSADEDFTVLCHHVVVFGMSKSTSSCSESLSGTPSASIEENVVNAEEATTTKHRKNVSMACEACKRRRRKVGATYVLPLPVLHLLPLSKLLNGNPGKAF